VSTGWERCFSVTWIIGFCGGAAVYYVVTLISPPAGKPYDIAYIEDSSDASLHGIEVDEEKNVPTTSAGSIDKA
jgi:nucleobase:cation symporter-1, NCS1 family